ncbi:MAG: DUF3854 domain-containing protein [Trichocoleus desertorum ATA4-8-CV12]|jgi:uncharacterized protein (DUF4415 family)|nr:DUF3854 domain-containing protein [Trichocoleus desertorum ATA4-8-CV12]
MNRSRVLGFGRKARSLPTTSCQVPRSLEAFRDKIEQEFCQGSGIDPELFEAAIAVELDLKQLPGGEVETPLHDALNWQFRRFRHQANSSQYGALFLNEDGSCWQAKLACPNWDATKRQFRKYESVYQGGSRAYLPAIDQATRQKIAARYGCDCPPEGESFWRWLEEHPEIPIIWTEGGKKALCLLSDGYVAIALFGVYGGHRSKDALGNAVLPYLIPDVQRFCQSGRRHILGFDQDVKEQTRQKVTRALSGLAGLLAKTGGTVAIAQWDQEQGKGVDDLVVNQGRAAWNRAYEQALSLEQWLVHTYRSLTYQAQVVVNQRYLGELFIPDSARLICLKAPKGTGKTEAMIALVQAAIERGQRVLILTHRIQLGQALCDRFGINYVTEIRDSQTGDLLGYGVCVDSLHPQSQAKFQAEHWKDPLVIMDEAEQVIWHTLNAATEVKRHRVAVLRELKQLLINALHPNGKGRVILSDADLTDLSIDLVKGVTGQPELTPWIVRNDWKPEQGANIYHYDQTTPALWYSRLKAHLQTTCKAVLIQLSAQKPQSTWGTRNVERNLRRLFPDKRILRIDSETISNPQHPAYGCISKLNEVLREYDIVIASPSIETGVSIDLVGHFDSVWGCFQGVGATDSVRQTLARLREPVDRHVWIARCGSSRIGNGAIHPNSLFKSQQKAVRIALKLLMNADFDDIATPVDPVYERTWARMACRINAGMLKYRGTVLHGLQEEGHILLCMIPEPEAESDQLKQERDAMKQEATAGHREECLGIEQAEAITDAEAAVLEQQRAKTDTERFQLRKHQLHQRYGIEVTGDLAEKDDNGWLPQLRLHYYLSLGRQYLEERDSRILQNAIASGNGTVWLPDLKGSLLIQQIVGMERLGILELLRPDRELRNSDTDLIQLKERLTVNEWQTKALFGIKINPNASPVTITRQMLKKLGLRLEMIGQPGQRGKQTRVYQVVGHEDGREAVFAAWLARDAARVAEVYPSDTVNSDRNNKGTALLFSSSNSLAAWFKPDCLSDVQEMVAAAKDDPALLTEVFKLVPPPVLKHLGFVA